MTRRSLLISNVFAAALAADTSRMPKLKSGPREIRVTIPNIRKEDLIDLLSTFFSKGQEKTRKRLEELFQKPADVTIVWTTKTTADNAIQIEVL